LVGEKFVAVVAARGVGEEFVVYIHAPIFCERECDADVCAVGNVEAVPVA
jgi:hypothetical protein